MKEQPELTVVMEPVEKLVPYANNANIHTNEQIDQIAASIQEFGFCDPVGVWTNEDGASEIVEGHGRVLAAKQLGMEELPVIYLNALSDDQRRAYTHVHNQLTRNSEFDFDKLEAELNSLDFDFSSLGFDGFEISRMSDGDQSDISQTSVENNGSSEIDLDEYSADKFGCICPRCGMRFNP